MEQKSLFVLKMAQVESSWSHYISSILYAQLGLRVSLEESSQIVQKK